jgi:hypothetical protein
MLFFVLKSGRLEVTDVEVFWPNGLHEEHRKISASRVVILREGAGAVPNRSWER